MPWFPVGFPLSHSIEIIFPSLWLRHSKARTGDWQKTYQLWDHDLFELSLLCQMAEEKWQLAAGNICIPLKLQEVAIFQEFFQDFPVSSVLTPAFADDFLKGSPSQDKGRDNRKIGNFWSGVCLWMVLIVIYVYDTVYVYIIIYIYIIIYRIWVRSLYRYKWHICWVIFLIIKGISRPATFDDTRWY
jgi:hypothetical protein